MWNHFTISSPAKPASQLRLQPLICKPARHGARYPDRPVFITRMQLRWVWSCRCGPNLWRQSSCWLLSSSLCEILTVSTEWTGLCLFKCNKTTFGFPYLPRLGLVKVGHIFSKWRLSFCLLGVSLSPKRMRLQNLGITLTWVIQWLLQLWRESGSVPLPYFMIIRHI